MSDEERLKKIQEVFIEKLKKTTNDKIDKLDIISLGEFYGVKIDKRSSKVKVIDKIVSEGKFVMLYGRFSGKIYIPAWEVAKFYNVQNDVINSLKALNVITEETKEQTFYNKSNKDHYKLDTYPIEILERYKTEDLEKLYAEAYKQDEFKIRIETETEEEVRKIILELGKVFIIERDPAIYERREKGYNSYLKIKISNNTELEENRYMQEIQKLKIELRENFNKKEEVREYLGLINRLKKEYDVTDSDDLFNKVIMGIKDHRLLKSSKSIEIEKEEEDIFFGTIQYPNGKLKGKVIMDIEKVEELRENLLLELFMKYGKNYVENTLKGINELNQMKLNRKNAGRSERFTDEEKKGIKELREKGKSIREIAKDFSCGVATIHKIINEH